MTTKELKKKILECTDIEWFNSITDTFDLPYLGFSLTLTGISSIYEFLNQQISGWENYGNVLPQELVASKLNFEAIKNQIVQFIESYSTQPGANLDSYWQNTRNRITALQTQKVLTYNSPQTEFLINIFHKTPNYFLGAFNYIVENNNNNSNNREILYGNILAYEFTFKDFTDISERRNLEKNSISKIRNDFQKYLSDSETQLVDHLNNANLKFDDYVLQIDDLKNEKNELFSEWFENTKNVEWKVWYDEKIDKIHKLEKTYETKLKLEKPARYWQLKSTKYYEDGDKAKLILFFLIGISFIFLALILVISPDYIFKTVFENNHIAIVRWSIVFITLISLIVFAVKALTKYMFSSYHLARDAEERHTLTFFYLSLLKDTEVKDDDRKLILQSLFSRVETGLLKDDSSPTMPSDIISKVISK
jgi:hypothetical protein